MARFGELEVVFEEITDPVERAQIKAQNERFERNTKWFDAHAIEIYNNYRGKCLCICGQELFVADTPEEAWAQAVTAHPEDDGRFMRYIPLKKGPRIYVL